METYTFLRAFADSWMLLAMFAFFIGVVLWVLRPGSSASHRDAAGIPLRHQDKPAQPGPAETKPAQTKEVRS